MEQRACWNTRIEHLARYMVWPLEASDKATPRWVARRTSPLTTAAETAEWDDGQKQQTDGQYTNVRRIMSDADKTTSQNGSKPGGREFRCWTTFRLGGRQLRDLDGQPSFRLKPVLIRRTLWTSPRFPKRVGQAGDSLGS